MSEEKKEENMVEIVKEKIKMENPSDNLKTSLKKWWQNINSFIGIYAWGIAYAVLVMIIASLLSWLLSFLGSGIFVRLLQIILVFSAILMMIYFFLRTTIGLVLFIKNDYQGKSKEIFIESKTYFWAYLGVSLLTAILVLLWALLLIIPGIIFSIFYAFAAYVFFFEGKKGMDALRRSKDLVKGYFWPVLGRIAFISVLLWLFMFFISIPLEIFEEGGLTFSLWNLLVSIISFLIGPIAMIYMINMYKDLVKIKK